MSIDDNKRLVQRFYGEFYNGRDKDAIDRFFAAGYVHHPSDLSASLMDFDDFKKRETRFLEASPDLTRDIEDQVAEDDRVATRSIMRGTQKGDLPELPSKGKTIEVRSIVIYRLADGKIVEGWENYDPLGTMMQLEVIRMVKTLSKARYERGDPPPGYVWPE
jgi:steroid delta-isomerase-like uncharacterized protein